MMTEIQNSMADSCRPRGRVQREYFSRARSWLLRRCDRETIPATIATGVVCGLFPFLGLTTVLTGCVGAVRRMNHVVLQTVNQLLGPLQVVMIPVYVRLGEWIWREPESIFSIDRMLTVWREASIAEFLVEFGWAGIHALTAWIVSMPPIYLTVFWIAKGLSASADAARSGGRGR